MAFVDVLCDTVTLIPPTDSADGQGGFVRYSAGATPNSSIRGVSARIEPQRQGRRLVAEQGDVGISTHVIFLQPYIYDSTGAAQTPIWGQLDIDWHVRDRNGKDYIVVAGPRVVKKRWGEPVMIEADLQVVHGGI
jgi:hypothetical protein